MLLLQSQFELLLLKFSQNEMQWQEIARGYENQWNYSQCIGALDGKHVILRAPDKEGVTSLITRVHKALCYWR